MAPVEGQEPGARTVTWHDRKLSPRVVAASATGALALVATLDYFSGHEISLSILYFAPLALVALFGSARLAWSFCVAAAGVWYGAELTSDYVYSHHVIPVWNAVVRLLIFALVTLLLRRLHQELHARAQLIAELRESLANVTTLSGLLPICAWCKNIRNDAGYWQRVESYLAEHAGATFTHGICPTCAAKVRAEHGLDDDDPPAAAPGGPGARP